MRKGALKKKQRQLEELHLDRREALGELVLGMFVQGNWDEAIMSRGAAEVREVAEELNALAAPPAAPADSGEHDLAPTGEHTAEHSMPETGEHTGTHVIAEPGMPETAEHTQEHAVPATTPAVTEPGPKKPETGKPGSDSPAATAESAPPKAGTPKPDTAKPDTGKEDPAKAVAAAATAAPKPPAPAAPGTPAPVAVDGKEEAEPQQKLSELDLLEEKIGKSESQARTAAEAARASTAADSRTELSAITREIEADRTKLTSTLSTASARIADAEKRAVAAEAKLARESAANREAAAGWVRSQAAEIEADAALAAEIAADPDGSPAAGADAGPRQAELEARIRTLETSLEAEKASKIEVLTIAESRLKAIEESAREAEKRVEEAEASLSEAGTAPVSVEVAPGIVTEAEAREAAVVWLRGQISALRQEISKGEASDKKGGT